MMGRRQEKRSKVIKRIAIGSSIAAAAGYAAGMLTAPKSGRETRQQIRDSADKGWSKAEKDLKKLHTELGDTIGDARKRGDKLTGKSKKEAGELVDRAKDAKEKVREVLSAVHEGDASDRDLKKAIKDAGAAVDHLRDFLKK